jgi:hypothetical protein
MQLKNKFYKVFNDIISKDDQKKFVEELYNVEFPWYLQKTTTDITETNTAIKDDKSCDTLGLVHVIYDEEKGINSHLYQPALNTLNNFLSENHIILEKLLRIKTNLVFKRVDNSEKYHTPHIDNEQNHYTLLYYVNNSDGPTYLFDNKYDGTKQNLNLIEKVNPEQGRAILLDGHYYHASSNPIINDYRLVINFNFKTKDKIDFSIL